MIIMFPQLQTLDFTKITDPEKDKARLNIVVNNAGGNGKKQSA
jgi:hypothetical protein